MEVIQDELQKNNVRIDIETLTEHVEYILNNYRDSYTQAVDRLTRAELLLDVFHEMDVNSLGRAMAYLTLVYRTSHMIKEDTVRQAVRLVAPVIRNTGRVEGSFIRELCAWGRSWVLNLWDLIQFEEFVNTFNFVVFEGGFIRELCAWGRSWVLNLWDLL